MRTSGSGSDYRVEERTSITADWQRGVEEGWINSMADPITLQAIKEVLARRPQSGSRVPGEPQNVMAFGFPRSVRSEQGRLEIIFEILEDDLTVWLEHINPVD